MKWILAICIVTICTVEAKAERPRILARAIANAGQSFHGNYGRMENSYWDTGSRIGAKRRAKEAWSNSPGHAANLPHLTRLRVVRGPNGIGVVGR